MPSVCTLLEPIALFSKRIGTEELASGAFDAEGPFDNHGRVLVTSEALTRITRSALLSLQYLRKYFGRQSTARRTGRRPSMCCVDGVWEAASSCQRRGRFSLID